MDEVVVRVLPDGRLSREEAAKFLGYKVRTLAEWHRLGRGPASRLVGGRRFYMIEDLRAFAQGVAA
jgi:DNA-binding transcriptional MerR regulator